MKEVYSKKVLVPFQSQLSAPTQKFWEKAAIFILLQYRYGKATIHRSHRFFPIDHSMGKFYGKPFFSHSFGNLWDFFLYPIEFLSVFPNDQSMGQNLWIVA